MGYASSAEHGYVFVCLIKLLLTITTEAEAQSEAEIIGLLMLLPKFRRRETLGLPRCEAEGAYLT